MTMRVIIENDDRHHTLLVTTQDWTKDEVGADVVGHNTTTKVAPRCTHEFYVHSMRTLLLAEEQPPVAQPAEPDQG